jgi:hypothetical protein
MSFSASTCLRYTSAPPLGTTINIYSDVDSYESIIVEVPTSDIIDGNCPYTFLVPDGTTNIRLLDPTSGCYSDIPIRNNDLCLTCDLDFNFYTGATVGRIIVGDITGSCQSSISDYIVNWYGPSPSTDIAFISGKGSAFTGYQFTHPLTGSSAILAEEGIYTPVIDKIMVDNIKFSQTGGTGYVQADLACFNSIPVTIEGYTCDNGGDTSNLSQYEHRVLFAGAASGAESPPLSATFNLSANTNYFAWKFKGNVVPDKLKLTFIGSAYPDPIILDYWSIGLNSDSYSNTNLPMSAYTQDYVNKVTVLTGLTVNDGDRIIIEITPNNINPQTDWDLYFTCLESFDCTYPPISKTPYKISGTTIDVIDGSCDQIRVNFIVTGCTTSEMEVTDFREYMGGSNYSQGMINYQVDSPSGLINANANYNLHWGLLKCDLNYFRGVSTVCSVANSNTITYKKYVTNGISNPEGVLEFTFSSLSDLTHYYNNYLSILSFSGTPANNTDMGYYRYINLQIPNSTGSLNCGDGTNIKHFYVHYSSIVTTGGTGPYNMLITMPTVSTGMTFLECEIDCTNNTSSLVNTINHSSTGTTNNYTGTTNTGSKYVEPFGNVIGYTGPNQIPAVTGQTYNGYTAVSNKVLWTKPVSGSTSPYTLIPELSGTTCPFISNDFFNPDPNNLTNSWYSYAFSYRVELTDPSDARVFNMYATPISSNGQPDTTIGNRVLIYTYDGTTGTVIDPAYFV